MLQAAERAFATRGFQATTMDEIAEHVGVTKPLIYDYFGSKEGLLAACVEQARRQLMGALIESWEARPQEVVRERVRGVVLAYFCFIDEHAQAFALIGAEGALIGDALRSVERIRQQTAKAFAQGLGTLPQFAAVDSTRVTVMAEIFIGGCERLAVWRSANPGLSSEAASELVLTTIWDGLAHVTSAS